MASARSPGLKPATLLTAAGLALCRCRLETVPRPTRGDDFQSSGSALRAGWVKHRTRASSGIDAEAGVRHRKLAPGVPDAKARGTPRRRCTIEPLRLAGSRTESRRRWPRGIRALQGSVATASLTLLLCHTTDNGPAQPRRPADRESIPRPSPGLGAHAAQ